MNKCRLKIICSNIINDIDSPFIKYVSKNERPKNYISIKEKNIINEEKNEFEENYFNYNVDIEQMNNNNNFENNEKYDINNIEENEKMDKLINDELENNNLEINNNKNIDSNELYTISNQHIYDENYFTPNISNNNTTNDFRKQDIINISSNINSSYKKEHDSSLKYIFKKRDSKYMNRSLSSQYSNKRCNQGNKLIKEIYLTNPVKYQNKNMKITNKIKNKNKKGNILNININKSFCINNNIKINNKHKSNPNSKNKTKSIRIENNSKNNITKNKTTINDKQMPKSAKDNLLKKVKPLKFNKRINKNKDQNADYNQYVYWNYIENSDITNDQPVDYKILMDELLLKECDLIKEKENIIKTYEEKLKPLRELNSKLIDDNNEELDKEDELRGELVILKNQYEILFSSLNKNNNKNLNNNIYINNDEIFDKKNKDIEKEIEELNNKLNKGEILLVTKPPEIINISKKENENIILMLKGLFYSIHIRDTDDIVNLIWKKDKKIQMIYFLVNELMELFNVKNDEKNLLINFFYSFCKKYNYMDIIMFKNELKKKIGNIQLYNKYTIMSKLMDLHRFKINELTKLMKENDSNNIGRLSLEKINNLLTNLNLFTKSKKESDTREIYEFIIINMKKDRKLKFPKGKNINIKDKINDNVNNYSLFDLFYESLIDLIDEFDSNVVSNPFELIRNYMHKKDINNAELIFWPLLKSEYIIKINGNEYFDIIILNKYLRKLGIIQGNGKISINCFEDELVDKNKFINDIYDYGNNI
jgi:hypothetical protein